MSKPQSYEEAQEELRKAFKSLGEALDGVYKITPTVRGLSKKSNWIKRKIAIYKFRRMKRK